MGDGVGRAGGDSGFELLEVIGDGGFLLAGSQLADGFDLERESAAGQVGAEHEKDRCPGEDSQLGPDRQEALGSAQKHPGAGIGADPGDVAVQVDRQAVAEGSPRTEDALDGHRRRQIAAQEHLGLRMRTAGVEPAIELARDVPGRWTSNRSGNPAAKQPVHPRDVGSQVAADQDRPSAFGERGRRRS